VGPSVRRTVQQSPLQTLHWRIYTMILSGMRDPRHSAVTGSFSRGRVCYVSSNGTRGSTRPGRKASPALVRPAPSQCPSPQRGFHSESSRLRSLTIFLLIDPMWQVVLTRTKLRSKPGGNSMMHRNPCWQSGQRTQAPCVGRRPIEGAAAFGLVLMWLEGRRPSPARALHRPDWHASSTRGTTRDPPSDARRLRRSCARSPNSTF